jgi:hypothetical protein
LSAAASDEGLRSALTGWFWRIAVILLPARWFQPELPARAERTASTGPLRLEIVSHCWNYSHLLAYQLSSLVLHPPQVLQLTMTVYYCPEDAGTRRLLDFFGAHQVANVQWNWRPLPRERLFRRAIGRNQAARSTRADWIWFTDCDVIFPAGCLDGFNTAAQGCQEALVHPRLERFTAMLPDDAPVLQAAANLPRLVAPEGIKFVDNPLRKATGPMQIAHGDVARACGYCEVIGHYQRPASHWRKTYEDPAFRWLLRSNGHGLEMPPPLRIRHISKGRYTGVRWGTRLRSGIRRSKSRVLGK